VTSDHQTFIYFILNIEPILITIYISTSGHQNYVIPMVHAATFVGSGGKHLE
jgi:hypothetical protein